MKTDADGSNPTLQPVQIKTGITDGIWWSRPWATVVKDLVDAAIYAVVTACAFAALWPNAAAA